MASAKRARALQLRLQPGTRIVGYADRHDALSARSCPLGDLLPFETAGGRTDRRDLQGGAAVPPRVYQNQLRSRRGGLWRNGLRAFLAVVIPQFPAFLRVAGRFASWASPCVGGLP